MTKTSTVQVRINQWRVNGYSIHVQNDGDQVSVWAAHKESEREVLLAVFDNDVETVDGGVA